MTTLVIRTTLATLLLGVATTAGWAQTMPGQPVLTPDRLEKFRNELADEAQQGPSGEALNEIARKAGYKTIGEVVKRLPVDDISSLIGSASLGDGDGTRQALQKGLLKVLAAEAAGAGTAVVTGTAVFPPLAIGILASVATGMAYDYVIESSGAALQAEIRRKQEELKSRTDMDAHQRDSYQFWISAATSQLILLQAEATMINVTIDQLAREVRAGKLAPAAYDAEYAKLHARYQGIVGEYAASTQNLRKLSGDRIAFLQKTLQGLRDEHRALKDTLDASGGHDAEASALMSQIYKEYLKVKKELDALTAK